MRAQSKPSLVGGALLVLFGFLSLVEMFLDLGPWLWVAVLLLAGFGVYGIYATDRTQKWILVVSYALLAVALVVFGITVRLLRNEAIATYVLLAIAVPFLYAYVRSDRTLWGLLIPAYILIAVGIMVGFIGLGILDGLLIPAYVLLAVSLPFFVVYLRDTKQWWPLIPGGITAVIGLSFLIASPATRFLVPLAIILAGVWILFRVFTRREVLPISSKGEVDEVTDGEGPTV